MMEIHLAQASSLEEERMYGCKSLDGGGVSRFVKWWKGFPKREVTPTLKEEGMDCQN